MPRYKLYKDHGFPHRNLSSNDQVEPIAHDGFGRSHSGDDACNGNPAHYHHHHSLANYQAELAAAARESSEFQTSGCNTPRQSAETLNSGSSMDSGDVGFDGGGFDSLVWGARETLEALMYGLWWCSKYELNAREPRTYRHMDSSTDTARNNC